VNKASPSSTASPSASVTDNKTSDLSQRHFAEVMKAIEGCKTEIFAAFQEMRQEMKYNFDTLMAAILDLKTTVELMKAREAHNVVATSEQDHISTGNGQNPSHPSSNTEVV
jgi:hypothetical protein